MVFFYFVSDQYLHASVRLDFSYPHKEPEFQTNSQKEIDMHFQRNESFATDEYTYIPATEGVSVRGNDDRDERERWSEVIYW